jgi:hypothetical protein
MVAYLHVLEHVCPIFLEGLPAVNRSSVRYLNSVLREERGQGSCIVVVPCLVKFISKRENLLAQLWIWRVCLLGKDRQSKADYRSAVSDLAMEGSE